MALDRIEILVDGENHFIRSVAALREVFDHKDPARMLSEMDSQTFRPNTDSFPHSIGGHRFGYNRECHFYWDCSVLLRAVSSTLNFACSPRNVTRSVYVTSGVGDDDTLHGFRTFIRQCRFEPVVIVEPKQDARNRELLLTNKGMIERAKGCDIALATRLVSDAAANLFDCCCLFTSDADFLPAVEAVHRLGKVVIVFGYADGLKTRSPFQFVPDRFVDLRESIKSLRTEVQRKELLPVRG